MKSNLAVGQGEQAVVGFLKRGFLKLSSFSSVPVALTVVETASGVHHEDAGSMLLAADLFVLEGPGKPPSSGPGLALFGPHSSASGCLDLVSKGFSDGSAPSLWNGCVAPFAKKGANVRSDGMTQSQKWPVGFGSSGEMVFYSLSVCQPGVHLTIKGKREVQRKG